MERLSSTLRKSLTVVAGTVAILGSAVPAIATVPPPVSIPEPTSLTLLSAGIAVAVLATRWLRRK